MPPGREPVRVVPYDPAWPARFEVFRDRLAAVLGPVAGRIEHVGSTSVPGLPAKPVIDIQVSVPDVEAEAAYRPPIESCGWPLSAREPGHRYFRPPNGAPRVVQVHVCSVGSAWERNHLLFRDHLRTHPETAEAYAALKRRLAAEHGHDRLLYTDLKSPFILGVLRRAGAGDIFPVPMTVTPALLRELKGHRVRLTLKGEAGGREGEVAGTLESADGLVLFLLDANGRAESVHYQSIESLEQV